ncbi:MAG: uracil-DNA glycosylase [Bacteroidia bacterium]|nr:uracil-DNA glycosylase [Bacteroidia bacterium]
MNVQIEESWKEVLRSEFEKPYFAELVSFLKTEKLSGQVIYPPGPLIFRAFELTPFSEVRVVLLGQDPYHGPGQAHGLCFSVPFGVPKPPSLVNIFQELQDDCGIQPASHGNLEPWAKQGVLLLNATLTVRAGQAGSHQKKGWETFTDAVIRTINDQKSGIVFLLWGKYAQEKGKIIDNQKHSVLKAAHPSPLSAHNGFLGCRHFSQTNQILISIGQKPIQWDLNINSGT